MAIRDKKAFTLTLLLSSVIALLFWTQSRFPALDEKAQMGQRTSISSIAFDVLVPLNPEDSYLNRVAVSALNWGYTNWKGMCFGILFAAAIWGLLSLVSFRNEYYKSSDSWLAHIRQSVSGALFGTPLGVCANCSTPIAFGFYQSGRPLAQSLSLLSSSPSFNFIVLGMSFSLLPFDLVVMKYVGVALFVFLIMPSLVWWLSRSAKLDLRVSQKGKSLEQCQLVPVSKSWMDAAKAVLKHYAQGLLFILKGTLPLMLLAGILGATLAEAFPSEYLLHEVTLIGLLFCALLATLFPVPIAFDVVISATLLAMGVDISYVIVVFFALGIFSVYPAMIIAKDVGIRLSMSLLIGVVLIAVMLGFAMSFYASHQVDKNLSQIEQGLNSSGSTKIDAIDSGENLDAYLLEPYLSKSLMRYAARQCHQLGEPSQFRCFEQFVINHLSTQFDARSCVYLEDALKYRQICDEALHYMSASREARKLDDSSICSSVADQYQTACRYDEVFERVLDLQSVVPCESLQDLGSQASCLDEGLAMNFELYENQNACDTLKSPAIQQQCQSQLQHLRASKQQFYARSLDSCSELESISDRRYCMGVTMVNLLEAGEDPEICRTIDDGFLAKRCHDFARYFDSLEKQDDTLCASVSDLNLRAECRFNVIQKVLETKLLSIREKFWITQSVPISSDADKTSFQSDFQSKQQRALDSAPALDEISIGEENISGSPKLRAYKLAEHTHYVQQDGQHDSWKRVEPETLGLLDTPPLNMKELFEPFSYGRGIASGDFNHDLWPDFATAHYDSIRIYQNTGGQFSLLQALSYQGELSPMLVAFADLNHDGLQDLFVSFYGGRNRIYWNESGAFTDKRYGEFSLHNTKLIMSLAMQDLDKDGRLDLVMGGWSYGDLRHFNPAYSMNYVLLNKTDKGANQFTYSLQALEGASGETLSVLLDDFDGDDITELMVGNDMDGPDILYRWDGKRFSLVKSNTSRNMPELSSFNTMSLASGDINGDLIPDYFSTDMSFGEGQGDQYCDQAGIADVSRCQQALIAEQALRDGRVAWCSSLEPSQQKDCFEAQLIELAKQSQDMSLCEKLQGVAQQLCISASERLPVKPAMKSSDYLESTQKNVLLLSGSDGYLDRSEEWGAASTYWSWNSQLVDVNNDGWLDLLVGNGYLFGGSGRNLQSNVMLLNQKGAEFAEVRGEFDDYLNVPSFILLDYDRDGDFDFIGHRVGANLSVLENNSKQSALLLKLPENEWGGRVLLETNKRTMMRKIGNSGGFLSFSEPVVHFGLASGEDPKSAKILWNSGGSTKLSLSDFDKGLIELDSKK